MRGVYERLIVVCSASADGDIFGHTFTPISSVGDIAPFIERVYANRKVEHTRVNAGENV